MRVDALPPAPALRSASTPTSPGVPAWVSIADSAALAALCLALAVAIGGGFRVWLGSVRVAVTSPVGPLLAGLLLLVGRHAAYRRPDIGTRYWELLGAAARTAAWRATWPVWTATRIGVLVVGTFAVVTVGYPRGEAPNRVSENEVVNLPMRWDAGWYYSISRIGYEWNPLGTGQQNIAFFPAYPMLTRIVARAFGGGATTYLVAGVLVSHAAFLWSLLLLYQLARSMLGEAAAAGAVALTAAYPFAVYHGAMYTESLFLLASVGSFWEFRRERWARAAAWGLLAGLTRPNGFLLMVPLAVEAWVRRGAGRGVRRSAMAVVAPLAGVAIFSLYIATLTGNPVQWSVHQQAWGRTFEGARPVLKVANDVAALGIGEFVAANPYEVLNGAAVLLAAALVVPVWRRFGLSFALLLLVNLLPPLLLGGTMSMGRLTCTMFPIFLWLAAAAPRQVPVLVSVFAMLQGLIAVLFYTWRPMV